MSRQEQAEKGAAERLAAEETRRAKRLEALPDLERQERGILEAVRPKAEAKLERLQERAALAREVQAEKNQAQQEAAREQARELKLERSRSKGLDRGMEH